MFWMARLRYSAQLVGLNLSLKPFGGKQTNIACLAWRSLIKWTARSHFENVISMMKSRLGANPIPVQYPIGEAAMFKGVIDLVKNKAIIWHDHNQGATFDEIDIPADLKQTAPPTGASICLKQ